MNQRIIEAMQAVEDLNNIYAIQTGDEFNIPFGFMFSSGYMCIEFFERTVWDDEDNDCSSDPTPTGEDMRTQTIYEHVVENVKIFRSNMRKFKP
jgi:hypothetical protein